VFFSEHSVYVTARVIIYIRQKPKQEINREQNALIMCSIMGTLLANSSPSRVTTISKIQIVR